MSANIEANENELPIIRIEPASGWMPLRLAELWEYRELFFFLTWRDIKVRYKQTLLGASWAIIQPLFTMLVFSLFFGKLAGIPSDDIPYPIFAFAALVPWTFFASSLSQSSNSLVQGSNLIKKVYFPRLALPISSVLAGIVDFFLAFCVLMIMMAMYGIAPTWRVIVLPFLLLLAFITALGVGLWLSAMNVRYRDVRYAVPFLIQFWMFATPIAYPSSMLSEPWRTVYGINPMVGVVEGFRWALLYDPADKPDEVASSDLKVAGGATIRQDGDEYFQTLVNGKGDKQKTIEIELTQQQYDELVPLAKPSGDGGSQVQAPSRMVAVSALASITILVSGAFYFRRMEKTFADVV
ncbi:MAG: ABC transporter permease [Rubripirellula sp.]